MKEAQNRNNEPKKKVKLTYADPADSLLKKLIINGIELASGRIRIDKIYKEVIGLNLPKVKIWEKVIELLGLKLEYDQSQLDKVPKEGPVIFVANHPFGVADGLALAHLVASVRSDFFVMVNAVLAVEEQVADFLLPIDFNESSEARRTNVKSITNASERLRNGEAFLIFPSGMVATARRPFAKKAEDFPWKKLTAKLVQETEATVIPIFVHGRNSRIFQLASHIHLNLRMGFLMHELRNKIGKTVKLTIGDPIEYKDVEHIKDRQELTDYYRSVTLALEHQ